MALSHGDADAPGTFATRVGLGADARVRICEILNERLADSFDLYSQTKQAHWNVKGEEFWQLHLLFDKLAETIEEHGDLLAERATALGGVARGTVRMAADASTLPEFPTQPHDGLAYVTALADRFAQHGNTLRAGIEEAEDAGDKGTADLLTELVRDVDKSLYFLEAHLQGQRRR